MLITVENVTHIYGQENKVKALDNINLKIEKNEFIGIIGPTGSGKSTLVQLFNALITPTSGKVFIEEKDIATNRDLKEVRRKIGLVFQYPEHQLFEETIYKEVAFGPKNLNLEKNIITQRVEKALALVGMDQEKYKERSPFELSGGQQRRIAIAGVLAMRPEVLILDEPFAGLDPVGKNKLVDLLINLNQNQNITIILISHQMDEIARLASRVVVMARGQIVLDSSPQKIFTRINDLKKLSLNPPQITEILCRLQDKGLNIQTDIFSVKKAAEEIFSKLNETGKSNNSG